MAHWIRVQNQRNRIKSIYDDLVAEKCLIIIDDKMKSDPIYFREKTVEHFGQKGVELAWCHGLLPISLNTGAHGYVLWTNICWRFEAELDGGALYYRVHGDGAEE